MKLLVSISILFILTACSEKETSRLDFMIGTWKVDGKEQYEVWGKASNNELTGYSYKIENGQKVVTETTAIKVTKQQLILEATVPDQNEGKTIRFPLNEDIEAYLSFENEKHDFPQKIQYKQVSENQIELKVLGQNDEGFSYTQTKQAKD